MSTHIYLGRPPISNRQWIENQKKTFVKYTAESEREDFFGVIEDVGEILYPKDVEIVRFGTSIASIGEGTFCNCTSLTSITIPNSLTSIGGSVFYGCTALASITIPDGVFESGGVFYNISPEPTFTQQSCDTIQSWFGRTMFGHPSEYYEHGFHYTIHCTDGTVVATPHYKEEADEWEWNIEITYNVE